MIEVECPYCGESNEIDASELRPDEYSTACSYCGKKYLFTFYSYGQARKASDSEMGELVEI